MAQVKDAVSVANKVFRTYENRRPERIAKEMGILIIPAPFKKQKGAYKVIERQPIIFIKGVASAAPLFFYIITLRNRF